MLDMIRANAPLKPEDARDMARLKDLTPDEGQRLMSSVYANNPTVFPTLYNAYNQSQTQEVQQQNRYGMEDYRALLRDALAQGKREAETPTQEQYTSQYGPLYQGLGMQLPPYSGMTHSETGAAFGRAAQAYNAQTTRTGQGTPRPSAVDQPQDPGVFEEVAKVMGRELPKGYETWTKRQYESWKTAKEPTPEKPEETSSERVLRRPDVTNYAYEIAQPKVTKTYKNGEVDFDAAVNTLMAKVAQRALEMQGDANNNAEKILKEIGWKPGMSGKDAEKLLDKFPTTSAAPPSADEIRRRIRKASGGFLQGGGQ
jgi:hypothetical protein